MSILPVTSEATIDLSQLDSSVNQDYDATTNPDGAANDKKLYMLGQSNINVLPTDVAQGFRIGSRFDEKVYIDDLDTEFLPLNCNWITSNLLPKYDENQKTFVEPYLPNYKIGIMHLAAGIWKDGKDMRVDKSIKIELETLDNKKINKSLRFDT